MTTPPPAAVVWPSPIEEAPTAADIAAAYPKPALKGDGSGRATIRCNFIATGRLTHCQVIGEDPPGFGFGGAALKVSALFRMRPKSTDGVPPTHGFVTIPIRFKLDQASSPNASVSTVATDKAPASSKEATRVPTHVVNSPTWERRPNGDDVASVYPDRAVRLGQSGGATLKCGVSAAGTLVDCQVVAETPMGFGFGLTVLRLVPKFKMHPQTVDGAPVNGGSVTIPIRFGVAPRPAATPDPNSRFTRTKFTIISWAPWALAPSGADVAAAFPERARTAQAFGQAALVCDLSRDGRLHGCVPTVEAADRLGFDRAAVGLASKFKADVAQLPAGLTGDTKVALSFDFSARSLTPAAERYARQPEWVRTYDAQDMAHAYPAAAAQAGVLKGLGTVDCTIGANGVLEACLPAGEEPVGVGFGAAAMKLAPMMQANLWTRDGEAAVGEKIRLPLRFAYVGATPAAK